VKISPRVEGHVRSAMIKNNQYVAPSSGYITNACVRPGDFAHKGEAMSGIVETGQWWVEANHKENLIGKDMPGQKVWITMRLHTFKVFEGRVISIGHGIGREPDQYPVPVQRVLRFASITNE
jgi:multidrug resistance efflux pump